MGVRHKVTHQVKALSSKYTVDEYGVIPDISKKVPKVILGVIREITLFFKLIKYPCIYYRYCTHQPFVSFYLFVLSFFKKKIWVEYNSKYLDELKLIEKNQYITHRVSLFWLRKSRVIHLPVTTEIGIAEKLPRYRELGNGYTKTCGSSFSKKDKAVLSPYAKVILQQKSFGKKIFIMCCSDIYPWNGEEVLIDFLGNREDAFVILVGKYAIKKWPSNFLHCGMLDIDEIYYLYNFVDFGIGTLALQVKGLNEACTLKVREYLCAGLPVIISYSETLYKCEWAKPYIMDLRNTSEKTLMQFMNNNYDRVQLQKIAEHKLSWVSTFENVGVL